jgi:hypothetical protein
MSESIWVGIISLLGTFFGTFSGIKLMSYRVEQLEKKVDKHNNLVERMALAENNINNATQRIDKLEERLDA